MIMKQNLKYMSIYVGIKVILQFAIIYGDSQWRSMVEGHVDLYGNCRLAVKYTPDAKVKDIYNVSQDDRNDP